MLEEYSWQPDMAIPVKQWALLHASNWRCDDLPRAWGCPTNLFLLSLCGSSGPWEVTAKQIVGDIKIRYPTVLLESLNRHLLYSSNIKNGI